jgi:hypothetical protein
MRLRRFMLIAFLAASIVLVPAAIPLISHIADARYGVLVRGTGEVVCFDNTVDFSYDYDKGSWFDVKTKKPLPTAVETKDGWRCSDGVEITIEALGARSAPGNSGGLPTISEVRDKAAKPK